jgi:hypothetical protein
VILFVLVHETLTLFEELQEYAKDAVQAKAPHDSFCVFKPERDRSQRWSLGEPRDRLPNNNKS